MVIEIKAGEDGIANNGTGPCKQFTPISKDVSFAENPDCGSFKPEELLTVTEIRVTGGMQWPLYTFR